MCDTHFTFPVIQGEFKKVTNLPDILNYGIYRVEILRSDDDKINRLFRLNEFNYYTHFDIQTARDLKFEMKLIIDDEANALLYTNKRANGGKYFKESIHQLYQLKKVSTLPKRIISAMWGCLCEKNKIKRTTRKPIQLNKGETVLNLQPHGDEIKVTYMKDQSFYKHNYARLGVFLLSKVRRDMATTILPHNEFVYRVHTDSILSSRRIPELQLGEGIGEWDIQNEGRVRVLNSNKVLWG
jgi:hypothetical protein